MFYFDCCVQVNAFVHCFVGVRRITSLYDLEVAICKNEGVDNFEELGLGPLLRHPLVIHYFSVRSDVTQVFKITSEEIIQLLSEFLDASKSKAVVGVEELLDFIAKKRSVKCREWLGIRIQNLGYVMSYSSYILLEGVCIVLERGRGLNRSKMFM